MKNKRIKLAKLQEPVKTADSGGEPVVAIPVLIAWLIHRYTNSKG